MRNYLALIRRDDFIDLFKYGRIEVNPRSVTEVDSELSELGNHPEVLDRIQVKNPFEYCLTYLLILFEQEDFEGSVSIRDVTHIYPLDDMSRQEFRGTFDPRIVVDEPLWPSAVEKLQKHFKLNDCRGGAANVMRIFQIDDTFFDPSTIIDNQVIKEAIDVLYSGHEPSGELKLWTYLLRYVRHAYFPKDWRGYFMDAVYVICNLKQKKVVEDSSVEKTSIFKFLERLQPELQFREVLRRIREEERSSEFVKKVNEVAGEVDFLVVAPAFLYLLDKSREHGLDYEKSENFVRALVGCGEKERAVVAYLLGVTLGYDKTYDCLYERFPLAIFKTKEAKPIIEKAREPNIVPSKMNSDSEMEPGAELEPKPKSESEALLSGEEHKPEVAVTGKETPETDESQVNISQEFEEFWKPFIEACRSQKKYKRIYEEAYRQHGFSDEFIGAVSESFNTKITKQLYSNARKFMRSWVNEKTSSRLPFNPGAIQ